MFRKFASALAVAGVMLGATAANAATIVSAYFPTGVLAQPFINAGTNEAGLNGLLDGYSGGTWSHTGTVQVVNPPPGSSNAQYRSPYEGTAFEDSARYTSVQTNSAATLTLSQDEDWFFFLWGSGDTYNTLSFWDDGILQDSFTGADLNPADTTSITAVGSYLVQITNLSFDTVIFGSTGANAFEFGNIQVGSGNAPAIPLPPALILLFSGLVGMGYLGRRRQVMAA